MTRPAPEWFLAAGLMAVSACAVPAAQKSRTGAAPLTVASATGQPYTHADGAAARRQADAQCGPRGVRTSIYDRFEAGQGVWVFPEGCA
jgi:hypothetical protein